MALFKPKNYHSEQRLKREKECKTNRESPPHPLNSAQRRETATGGDRLSFPFFFDPGWEALVRPVPFADEAPPDDAGTRWDRTSVHEWHGTYGDYLMGKVSKVFPDLAGDVR